MQRMMRSETLRDRLLQVTGLIILAGLTAAFVFAFREKMLPQQEEGDVFGTVYAMSTGDEPGGEAEPDRADLPSDEES